MMRTQPAIVVLSPERWDAAPTAVRELVSQCARDHRVVVIEPPVFDSTEPELELRRDDVIVAVPHFEPDTAADVVELGQRRMLDRVFDELATRSPILWYRSADALGFTHHVEATAIVYAPCTATGPSTHDVLLREHADVVLADASSDWSAAWETLERAMMARTRDAA
jgi:hypothetical protein